MGRAAWDNFRHDTIGARKHWETIKEHRTQCGKTRNSLSLNFFRQINCLVISLVKPFHEIFAKKVREDFCNFHTVHFTPHD